MRSHVRTFLLLALLVGVTVLPFLGNAYLFDWDEVNFAECAREMLVSGDYYHPQIDFEPFWEKPPLFFWLQAGAMHLFGVTEFAARFPNAIVGIATVLLLAYTGRRWVDETFGALWALLWIGSLLPNFYMHSGLIDPLFNFLMIASTVLAFESTKSKRRWLHLGASGIILGLAVLTKGPVALLLVGIPLLILWWRQFGLSRTVADVALVGAMSIVPFGVWLLGDRSSYGQWFMRSFLEYQVRLLTTDDAGHSGPLYYHVLVLLLGCFPASWLAFGAFRSEPSYRACGSSIAALCDDAHRCRCRLFDCENEDRALLLAGILPNHILCRAGTLSLVVQSRATTLDWFDRTGHHHGRRCNGRNAACALQPAASPFTHTRSIRSEYRRDCSTSLDWC